MIEIILSAILSLAPAWYAPGEAPETDVERQTRMQTIARAISLEVPEKQWQAAVIALGWHESRYSLETHQGTKLGDRGRSISVFQHQRHGLTRAEWRDLAGTRLAATRRAVALTYERLKAARRWCGYHRGDWSIAGAFSLYGHGSRCDVPRLRARAETYRRVLARLRKKSPPTLTSASAS